MHYTRSIIARKLRRIARLLRYADFASAHLGIEKAINDIKHYNGTLDSLEKALNGKSKIQKTIDNTSFKLYNIMTLTRHPSVPSPSKMDSLFQNLFNQFRKLYPDAIKVLEEALNTHSIKDMKITINNQRDLLNNVLSIMAKIKSYFDHPDVKVPFDSIDRQINSSYLNYQNFFDNLNYVLKHPE